VEADEGETTIGAMHGSRANRAGSFEPNVPGEVVGSCSPGCEQRIGGRYA